MGDAVEQKLIQPFLHILESVPANEKEASLMSHGFGVNTEGFLGAYSLSKAAVNSYTMDLARRFPSLIITSCCPGFVETDLTRVYADKQGKTPAEMGMVPVEQGAVCPVYLMTFDVASLPGFSSGWYFSSDCKR